jgi:hypothetical protein
MIRDDDQHRAGAHMAKASCTSVGNSADSRGLAQCRDTVR